MIYCGFFPYDIISMLAPPNSYSNLIYFMVGYWILSLNLNYKLSESRCWICKPTQLSTAFQVNRHSILIELSGHIW